MSGGSDKQNVTLALPRRLLRRLKILAAERETSVSSMLTRALEDIVGRDDAYREAMDKEIEVMRRGLDLRVGKITWTRHELHDRQR